MLNEDLVWTGKRVEQCTCIDQVQKGRKGGSIYIYVLQKCLVFTKKENLSTDCDDFETLAIDIVKVKDKNVFFILIPANGSIKIFHEYL